MARSKLVRKSKLTPAQHQRKQLIKLLTRAQYTAFGRQFGFSQLLAKADSHDPAALYQAFKQAVPVYNYNTIHQAWWHRCLAGEADVTWPGTVKYFALSSGTSEASSKYIPITPQMFKSIQRTAIQQILDLPNFDLPATFFSSGVLMLGGSTNLNHHGNYYSGDLSGIQTSQLPTWFQMFYKPGKRISAAREWGEKLDEIVAKAPSWNIGVIAGVPAWVQILMEKIVAKYNVKNIHEIWPNLQVYVHGGVAFEPYKKSFDRLLGKPLKYIETYLASEGSIAYQRKPTEHMKLVLNRGLYFEFVPFTDDNFDGDGEINPNCQTLTIDQVEVGKDYALLLNTNAGAWRYLIGDTIRFTNKETAEIVITGRTKHFLSLCGEHLSVDNMNAGIARMADQHNLTINEFCVAGVNFENLFGHNWYIGVDQEGLDEQQLIHDLDLHLKDLNDDYAVERMHGLKNISLKVLPTSFFYDFMRKIGKEGGQNKFPRVLKKAQLQAWNEFLQEKGLA